MPDPVAAKQQQRKTLRGRLAALSPEQCAAASSSIIGHIHARLGERLGGGVLAFYPLHGEPDLRPLLQELLDKGLPVSLPRVHWEQRAMTPTKVHGLGGDHLRAHEHDVVEPIRDDPIPLEDLSIILVPGLGFDDQGRRLGRGGGFYDLFLPTCPEHILAVGIGFQQQVLERVETGPFDVSLPMVITDAGIIEPGSSTMHAD